MWHFDTTTMPIITRVLGMIKNNTDKHIMKCQKIFHYLRYQKLCSHRKKLPLLQVFGKGRKLEIIIIKFEPTILCRTKLK